MNAFFRLTSTLLTCTMPMTKWNIRRQTTPFKWSFRRSAMRLVNFTSDLDLSCRRFSENFNFVGFIQIDGVFAMVFLFVLSLWMFWFDCQIGFFLQYITMTRWQNGYLPGFVTIINITLFLFHFCLLAQLKWNRNYFIVFFFLLVILFRNGRSVNERTVHALFFIMARNQANII